MEDIQRAIQEAVQRRDRLQGQLQRLQGRRESAQARLAELEALCRSKGVEPEHLDSTIEKVEKVYQQRAKDILTKVEIAEQKLAPYLEGVSS